MPEFLKTPFNLSLNKFAGQKAQSAIQLLGKSLPCSVVEVVSSGIVRVKFELTGIPFTLPEIVVPIEGSQYVRQPIQIGDKGKVVPADAHLGGMTGLGGGTANMTQPMNLSALSFQWLGDTEWTAPIDANAAQLSGPNGAVLTTDGHDHVLKVSTTEINADDNLRVTADEFGVFGMRAVQGTVTGPLSSISDAATKTVLTSLIGKLAALGLIIDGTT